jgi:hypothetical protein
VQAQAVKMGVDGARQAEGGSEVERSGNRGVVMDCGGEPRAMYEHGDKS